MRDGECTSLLEQTKPSYPLDQQRNLPKRARDGLVGDAGLCCGGRKELALCDTPPQKGALQALLMTDMTQSMAGFWGSLSSAHSEGRPLFMHIHQGISFILRNPQLSLSLILFPNSPFQFWQSSGSQDGETLWRKRSCWVPAPECGETATSRRRSQNTSSVCLSSHLTYLQDFY